MLRRILISMRLFCPNKGGSILINLITPLNNPDVTIGLQDLISLRLLPARTAMMIFHHSPYPTSQAGHHLLQQSSLISLKLIPESEAVDLYLTYRTPSSTTTHLHRRTVNNLIEIKNRSQ
jgi:hypothetical protein